MSIAEMDDATAAERFVVVVVWLAIAFDGYTGVPTHEIEGAVRELGHALRRHIEHPAL